MTHPWKDMKWWDCGERQAAEEKLHDLRLRGDVINPDKSRLYGALSSIPEREVRVAIIGQDPYPTKAFATGVAFSIPSEIPPKDFPQTLRIILQEYHSDLGYRIPDTGNLKPWSDDGVLLWNSIPSCRAGHSLSHDWAEWEFLTGEIVERLSAKGIVFAFLGAVARRYEDRVDLERNRVICTSHPSPRGIRSSKTPFTGSRPFSTINAKLRELGQETIDWRLDHDGSQPDIPEEPVRGNLLPNITGVSLPGLRKQGTSPNIYTSLAF